MKGLLKIYHPEETLKYHLKNTYCKSVYSNAKHSLEVEIITDDNLDNVEDDSLQYNFPQLSLKIYDFPIDSAEISGKTFTINDTDDEAFTEVDLHNDEDAYIYNNELSFSEENGEISLIWKGEIDDFYTNSGESIPFKLKCHFKQDEIEVEE